MRFAGGFPPDGPGQGGGRRRRKRMNGHQRRTFPPRVLTRRMPALVALKKFLNAGVSGAASEEGRHTGSPHSGI